MPSNKILEQKKQLVDDLAEKLKNATTGVVIDYRGITVAEDTALRREFREANVEYIVVKNNMLKLAAEKAGITGLEPVLEGTTSLALCSEDAIAPAKIAAKYSDELKTIFNIKAGFMDGKVMSAEETIALGKLPSKEQLLGQLLSVLNGNLRGLACALNAIAEQKESA